MIPRPHYIEIFRTYRDVPVVKILAGIRRCGKSTLLEMLADDLERNGVAADHIVKISYTSEELGDGMTDKEMYRGVTEQMTDSGQYYLLLDEVQEVAGWEKAVNGLLEKKNTDIYVTGSNSKLMAGEISSYLSGRYVTIPVYTLSFAEYLDFKASTRRTPRRHDIKNVDLFNRVVKFIVENVGKTFSANAIVKFLKSEGRALSVETIYNYLEWLEKAFVIYRCQRYDLKGKSVLKTQEKFYLADTSLKYCMMGFQPESVAAVLENVVYFELRRRGYDVYIGKNEAKEIDFVAVRRDERIYVQVCRNLPQESDRETANLLEIKDHYPKYVVTMDELAAGNIDGVKIVHLSDFLLSS